MTRDNACGHPPTTPGEPERLYKVPELADWLCVSTSTVYQMNHTGDGPPRIRFGNQVRYRQCCVDAWLQQHSVDTREPT